MSRYRWQDRRQGGRQVFHVVDRGPDSRGGRELCEGLGDPDRDPPKVQDEFSGRLRCVTCWGLLAAHGIQAAEAPE